MKSMAHRFDDMGRSLDALQDMLVDIYDDTESNREHPDGKVVGPFGVARALGVHALMSQIQEVKETLARVHAFETMMEDVAGDPLAESIISMLVKDMIQTRIPAEMLSDAGIRIDP